MESRKISLHHHFLCAGLLLCATANASAAIILSDNLSKTTESTEAATASTWLAASFRTGTSSHVLNSVTVLLSASSGSQAQLSLYSDGGLQPGSSIGTLVSPSSYSSVLTNTIFTTSGIALASNSTYWIVLRPLTGQFNWAWTLDNTGDGVGFQHTWGVSDNAGQVWFSSDIYPTQFSVSADAVTSGIPEPGTFLLTGASVLAAVLIRFIRTSLIQ